MNRRDLLKWSGVSGLVLAAPRSLLAAGDTIVAKDVMYHPTTPQGFMAPLAVPGDGGLFGVLDVDRPLSLSAAEDAARLFPDNPSAGQGPLLGYVAQQGWKRYVNPTLRVRKGQPVRCPSGGAPRHASTGGGS